MRLTEKDGSEIITAKEHINHKRENLFTHLHKRAELRRIAPGFSTVLQVSPV